MRAGRAVPRAQSGARSRVLAAGRLVRSGLDEPLGVGGGLHLLGPQAVERCVGLALAADEAGERVGRALARVHTVHVCARARARAGRRAISTRSADRGARRGGAQGAQRGVGFARTDVANVELHARAVARVDEPVRRRAVRRKRCAGQVGDERAREPWPRLASLRSASPGSRATGGAWAREPGRTAPRPRGARGRAPLARDVEVDVHALVVDHGCSLGSCERWSVLVGSDPGKIGHFASAKRLGVGAASRSQSLVMDLTTTPRNRLLPNNTRALMFNRDGQLSRRSAALEPRQPLDRLGLAHQRRVRAPLLGRCAREKRRLEQHQVRLPARRRGAGGGWP